jgi:hypothetical protein
MPPGLDPNFVFGEMAPLISIVTIILVGALGLRWVFRTPVGEALAQRIRGGRVSHKLSETEGERAREMEARLTHLQEQVGELAERLDFAERMLAAQRERLPLKPGS